MALEYQLTEWAERLEEHQFAIAQLGAKKWELREKAGKLAVFVEEPSGQKQPWENGYKA